MRLLDGDGQVLDMNPAGLRTEAALRATQALMRSLTNVPALAVLMRRALGGEAGTEIIPLGERVFVCTCSPNARR